MPQRVDWVSSEHTGCQGTRAQAQKRISAFRSSSIRIVGLTGGIASGKSTVSAMLQRRGYPVADADKISRDVLNPGEPALAALIERFGHAIVDEHGRLKRRELGKTVFGDDEARHDLNTIVHPAVARRSAEVFSSWVSSGKALGFYDAALLFETGSYRQFAMVLVVAAPVELQMMRIASRDLDLSEEDARARIAAQMPLEDKVQRADVVIYNDTDLPTLERRVDQALARIHEVLGLNYTGASHG